MGRYNSSVYRVRPLMQVVEKDIAAFHKLLSLVGIAPLGIPNIYLYDGEGCAEKQLKPSKRHLAGLISYMAEKDHTGVSVTNAKRRRLFFPDPSMSNSREATCRAALAELEENYDALLPTNRAWYVFEGFTNPDIFIEGDDYVIVCEGKWTEPHITTKTTNLSADNEYRNQMVRHIQGALNYTNKKVYAFYIVDKGCGYEADLSTDAFAAQLEKETIEIPGKEKEEIIRAFYGYTTWQDIKNVLPAVDFKTKAEIG